MLNSSDQLEAKQSNTDFVVLLDGPGSSSSGPSVRMRNTSNGVDYYAGYCGTGYCVFYSIPDGEYNVFVCTNYPSHGDEYGVKSSAGYSLITLGTGVCPYGND